MTTPTSAMDQKTQMREGFEAQRKAGMNIDWFTWQIAWHDALFTVHDIAGDALARQPAAIDTEAVRCRVCNGHGYRTAMSATGEGAFNETCVYCGGTGKASLFDKEAAVTREEIERARDRVLEQSKNSLFRSGVKICAGEILSPTEPCDKPPAGWTCSRTKGHEGPCAASPAAPSVEQDERGAFEAWFKVDRKRAESCMWRVNESDAWAIWQARAASISANVAQENES